MKLILARHGNTFGPHDKVTWVGSKNDLPLVEQGVTQAERAGKALKDADLSAIYFAPLRRTKTFAETVATESGTKARLIEDQRLMELNYGQWSGLNDKEIADKFGEKTLMEWVNHSVWPKDCGWTSDESIVRYEVKDLVNDITERFNKDATVLLVSSNGRLRYFLSLIEGEFDRRVAERTFKVGTGKVCLLIANGKGFELALWNEQPEALSPFIEGKAVVAD